MQPNPSPEVEPNLPDSKPWWQSKTIQGAIVILGGLIARSAFGERAPTEGEISQVLDLGASILGLALVIVGRFTATTTLR